MTETLALRHVPFEDLGLLAPLLQRRGHALRYLDVPTADLEGMDPAAPDLLVVLGGPISAYDEDIYPYLAAERALIARRIEAGRPVLGICLGGQLIARALGARVYPNGVKEIGWAPLELTQAGRASCLRHLADTPVLHWHGDTFELPAGAERLAATPACENQAFKWGEAVLALQFHAEAAGRALEAWFVGHAADIGATPGVNVPQLRTDTAAWTPRLAERAPLCFGEWLDAAGL
jgi:GMP synthase (glutamine-hydrolysing)